MTPQQQAARFDALVAAQDAAVAALVAAGFDLSLTWRAGGPASVRRTVVVLGIVSTSAARDEDARVAALHALAELLAELTAPEGSR